MQKTGKMQPAGVRFLLSGRNVRVGATMVLALAVAIAVALLAALTLASAPAEAHKAGSYAKLKELRLRADTSMTGYSRDKFRHWSDAQEYGWRLPSRTPDPGSCDVRDAALIRDGKRVRVGSGCYVKRGRWRDPYTGNLYYRPSDIDIDHMVPLAEAWRAGAKRWSSAKRERFANNRGEVLAVEDNANASKGDREPEAWKPPRKAYWCTYSKKWINIKHRWNLTATRAEKRTLRDMLGTCR
jgi:hypothetical protein